MTPPPTVTDLEQIYSTNINEQKEIFTLLGKSFQERFGCNPVFYSRVNWIGEHIDYSESYTFDITGDRNPISVNTQDHH